MKVHFDYTYKGDDLGVRRSSSPSFCGSTRIGGQWPHVTADWEKVTCHKCRPDLTCKAREISDGKRVCGPVVGQPAYIACQYHVCTRESCKCPQPTQNEDYGFFGTWKRHREQQVDKLWPTELAFNSVAGWLIEDFGRSAEQAREWLDSRMGRHFADFLADEILSGGSFYHAIRSDMARKHMARPADAPFGG